MLQEISSIVSEDIGSSPYTGDNLKKVNLMKSGINYAYGKLCREKVKPYTNEIIVLDSNKDFDVTTLTKELNEINMITSESGLQLDFFFVNDTDIRVDTSSPNANVIVYYYYIAPELTNSTDKVVHANGSYDNKGLCYYGAYHYLTVGTDSSNTVWLNLYNDWFDNIRPYKGVSRQVKSKMRW